MGDLTERPGAINASWVQLGAGVLLGVLLGVGRLQRSTPLLAIASVLYVGLIVWVAVTLMNQARMSGEVRK